nr:putative E3 ubiquitin-protein ligase RZFP34 isoform B [Ipomoea batatas]
MGKQLESRLDADVVCVVCDTEQQLYLELCHILHFSVSLRHLKDSIIVVDVAFVELVESKISSTALNVYLFESRNDVTVLPCGLWLHSSQELLKGDEGALPVTYVLSIRLVQHPIISLISVIGTFAHSPLSAPCRTT